MAISQENDENCILGIAEVIMLENTQNDQISCAISLKFIVVTYIFINNTEVGSPRNPRPP